MERLYHQVNFGDRVTVGHKHAAATTRPEPSTPTLAEANQSAGLARKPKASNTASAAKSTVASLKP